MKERILALKGLIKDYNNLYNDFENKKTLFNLRVDDLCEEYECGLAAVGLTEEEVNKMDNYSKARDFFNRYSSIIVRLNMIRKNNPNADRKKLNALYLRYLTRDCGFDYISSYMFVSNYSIFIEAGYYKTVGYESTLNNSLRRITNQTEKLKKEGINTFDIFIRDAKAKLRPYTDEVLNKVKPMVHQGSKTLVKVFTRIADKTQKKND